MSHAWGIILLILIQDVIPCSWLIVLVKGFVSDLHPLIVAGCACRQTSGRDGANGKELVLRKWSINVLFFFMLCMYIFGVMIESRELELNGLSQADSTYVH